MHYSPMPSHDDVSRHIQDTTAAVRVCADGAVQQCQHDQTCMPLHEQDPTSWCNSLIPDHKRAILETPHNALKFKPPGPQNPQALNCKT